jgi:hypothetical protein
MSCKGWLSCILPIVILFSIFPGILYNMPLAGAQQDNTNFLTYTNTDLGFTIKYPSDWTVDESGVSNDVAYDVVGLNDDKV